MESTIVTMALNAKELNRLQRSYLIESKPFKTELEATAKKNKRTVDEEYAASLLRDAINGRFEDAQKRTLASVEKAIETLKAQGMDVVAVGMEAQLAAIKDAIKAENAE
jgi:2-iminoacetate synthase ThiH